MFKVTNPKIADIAPTWARFRGFSILFDNPGAALISENGLDKVHGSAAHGQELYDFLEDGASSIGGEPGGHLAAEFSFCPLPRPTYHVTVWDGINDDNIDDVGDHLQLQIRSWFECLPSCAPQVPDPLAFVKVPLFIVPPMSFRFRQVAVWNGTSLVAELRLDARSDTALRELESMQLRMNRQIETLGVVRAPARYIPHVTLGYFADEGGGSSATKQASAWTAAFDAAVQGASIHFSSVNFYVFTDMVSYYRLNGSSS